MTVSNKAENCVDPTPLQVADYPIYYMWHIASESQRCVREAIVSYELSWQDWRIIFLLHDRDGLTINELASEVLIDATTLTKILRSMEDRKLLKRKKGKGDQRYTSILLTSNGRALYQKIIPIVLRQLDSAFRGIKDDEKKTLDRILRKMKDNVYRSPFANLE